ncbi:MULTISPECIES: hypothetical protein [Protofrankia]|uniref:Uncharacterized protein n=1 Tax=Protofrankia coriariae TaxID=1562887 RepID=A0ABR5F2A9_9ACTN|nr:MULTISPECIES: hypothetical protein [Protofrankia]KLL10834.1 hypothetical protein FrCorBMG51_15620 [Protofrankia coriariae]ONH34041.1 hypothetical protein BL254_18580 [Protofrankia sp. BMG5.30]
MKRSQERSTSIVSLHVGPDASVTCRSHDHRPPFLMLRVGGTSVNLTTAGRAVTRTHIAFAYALRDAVNDFLIECEALRLPDDSETFGDGPAIAA